MEEQIYAAECITGIKIEYADNQPCIDMIDKPPLGLFQLLDSTCKTPKATDELFCTNIYEQHSKHPCLVVPKRRPPKDVSFTVRHFAGTVTYSVAAFLEKNNDSLDGQFKDLLSVSSNGVTREMLQIAVAREAAAAAAASKGKSGGRPAAPASVSKRFSASLASLVQVPEQPTDC